VSHLRNRRRERPTCQCDGYDGTQTQPRVMLNVRLDVALYDCCHHFLSIQCRGQAWKGSYNYGQAKKARDDLMKRMSARAAKKRAATPVDNSHNDTDKQSGGPLQSLPTQSLYPSAKVSEQAASNCEVASAPGETPLYSRLRRWSCILDLIQLHLCIYRCVIGGYCLQK